MSSTCEVSSSCVLYRQVTLEEANAKATQLNIMFMETSAKAGHNVKSLFKKIAMSLVGMEKENEQTEAQNTSTYPAPRPLFVALTFTLAEIDVTSPPQNDIPDASQCQC